MVTRMISGGSAIFLFLYAVVNAILATPASAQPYKLSYRWPENMYNVDGFDPADLFDMVMKREARAQEGLQRRASSLKAYALAKQPAWNKPFLFGKRSVPLYDIYRPISKRSVSDTPAEVDKRKVFKLGKRDSVGPGIRDEDDEDVKRAQFRFGRKSYDDDFAAKRRKFLFGKRPSPAERFYNDIREEVKRRMFKFGKRMSLKGDEDEEIRKFENEDLEDAKKRARFKFGKRNPSEDQVDEKRALSFEETRPQFAAKPLFKFGKKSSDVTDLNKPIGFKFGTKLTNDSGKEDVGKKAKFKFGKRESVENGNN